MKLTVHNKSHITNYEPFKIWHIDIILDAKAFNLLVVYRR